MDEGKKPQPGVGRAVLAGTAGLLGLPVGLAVFAVHSGAPTQAFNEGGTWMFACVGVAALCGVGVALSVFFATRGSATAAAMVCGATLAIVTVGAAGWRSSLAMTMAAVEHVAPRDVGIIAAAGASESAWNLVLACFLAAGLAMFGGLGLLLGGRRQAGVAALALGGALAGAGRSTQMFGEALVAVAHVSPMDKLTILLWALASRTTAQGVELVLAGVFVGVSVVALRGERPAAAALGAGVAALGLIHTVGALPAPAEEAISRGLERVKLRELDAMEEDARDFTGLVLDEKFHIVGGDLPMGPYGKRLEAAGNPFTGSQNLYLGLGEHVTVESFDGVLREAHDAGFKSVTLVGVHSRPPPPWIRVPPPFVGMLTSYTGLRVYLSTEAEACPKPCAFATLDASGLHWSGKVFPLADRSHGYVSAYGERAEVIPLRWRERFEPQVLLGAAHAAAEDGRALQLVLPP